MIPIAHRHDNYAPTLCPVALEAFLARQRVRRERAIANVRMLAMMTPRQLARHHAEQRAMSFLPPGSNIHRSRNLYLPDSQTDPFAAQVVFLAHYDSTFNSVLGTIGTPTGATPPVLGVPPQFGAQGLQFASGTGRCTYPGAGILFGNGALTVEMWYRPLALAAGSVRYVMSSPLIGGSINWSIHTNNATSVVEFNCRGGNVSTGVAIATGSYIAYALSVADGTPANGRAFYINGVRVNLGTEGAGNAAAAGTFAMGDQIGPSTQGMAGSLDEVRITLAQRYTTASYTVTGPFPNP